MLHIYIPISIEITDLNNNSNNESEEKERKIDKLLVENFTEITFITAKCI